MQTTLYIYEFNVEDFYLQDEIAGYYVSQNTQKPINKIIVHNILEELTSRNVEVRIVPSLESIANRVKHTNLDWSLCSMGYAKHHKSKFFLTAINLSHIISNCN